MKARVAGPRPKGLTRNRLLRLLAPAGRCLWQRPDSLRDSVEPPPPWFIGPEAPYRLLLISQLRRLPVC